MCRVVHDHLALRPCRLTDRRRAPDQCSLSYSSAARAEMTTPRSIPIWSDRPRRSRSPSRPRAAAGAACAAPQAATDAPPDPSASARRSLTAPHADDKPERATARPVRGSSTRRSRAGQARSPPTPRTEATRTGASCCTGARPTASASSAVGTTSTSAAGTQANGADPHGAPCLLDREPAHDRHRPNRPICVAQLVLGDDAPELIAVSLITRPTGRVHIRRVLDDVHEHEIAGARTAEVDRQLFRLQQDDVRTVRLAEQERHPTNHLPAVSPAIARRGLQPVRQRTPLRREDGRERNRCEVRRLARPHLDPLRIPVIGFVSDAIAEPS